MAYVTVYENVSGTITNGDTGFNVSIPLPDSIYARWGVNVTGEFESPHYPYAYEFCFGPGCKADWASGSGLFVQMFSTTAGWLNIDQISGAYGSNATGWPFGPQHEPLYSEGRAIRRNTNTPWLFDQTVQFRIKNTLPPPLFGPFGIMTPGPSSLSFSGLTFTIGDQCELPPPPPPEATTFVKHARALALPYGFIVIFGTVDPIQQGSGQARATII